MVAGALLVLASAALVPGGLRALTRTTLRWQPLLPLALGLQVLFLGVLEHQARLLVVAGHLLSYVVAAVFVWRNRAVPGLTVLALGAFTNAVTISLNGGTLPASAEALRTAGRSVEADGFTNSGVLEDPVLPWLGDVFAVPASVPFANVFSVGDVLILLGAALVVHGHRLGPVPAVQVDVLHLLPRGELEAEVLRARAALERVHRRHLALSAEAGTAPLALAPAEVRPRPRLVVELPPEPVPAEPDVLLTLPRAELLAEVARARTGLVAAQARHEELQAQVAAVLPALVVVGAQRPRPRDLSVA